MSEQFNIHPCNPDEHGGALFALIQELADFEKMTNGPKLTAEKIADDLKNCYCFGYIASTKDDSSGNVLYIGYCLCYYAYSTWEGRFIFLEDLYVKPEYRKLGVGTKLLKCLLQRASTENSPRVQWNVLNWNTTAIEYYKGLGAVDLHETEGWVQFRMTKEAIEKFNAEQ